MLKRFALLLLTLGIGLKASAVPAYPEPFTFTQPDGSTITLMAVGDEFQNGLTTADGLTVEKGADGFMYYRGHQPGEGTRCSQPHGRRSGLYREQPRQAEFQRTNHASGTRTPRIGQNPVKPRGRNGNPRHWQSPCAHYPHRV